MMDSQNAALLVGLILQGLARITTYGQLLQKARDEGRAPTDEELNALASADDQLKLAVEAEIARRGG